MSDNTSKAWVGSLIGGLGVVVAMNWSAFFQALQMVPSVITEWLTKLPFEALSAFLAFGLAVVTWLFAFLHPAIFSSKPQTGADWSAVGSAMITSLALCWASGKSSPMAVILALVFGFIAGCVGALIARLGWSTLTPPKEKP